MDKELQELFSEASSMISKLGRYNGNDNEYQARKALRSIEAYISEFFSQNICIPRGENPHPYADVLHEWIENTTQYLESKQSQSDKGFYKVYLFGGAEYRIKPSEPVYEWQWYYVDDGIAKIHPEFMTHGEVTDFRHSFIIEETKRERK